MVSLKLVIVSVAFFLGHPVWGGGGGAAAPCLVRLCVARQLSMNDILLADVMASNIRGLLHKTFTGAKKKVGKIRTIW